MPSDEYWMKQALREAVSALNENEVPIGAVLVKDNKLFVKNHNRTKQSKNNLTHAEKLVIEEALKTDKYLYDYTLYVTIEPCLMCAGAIILARVGKVVFGSYDIKAGAVGSVYNALLDKNFNHHPQIVSGVLKEECSAILKDFFRKKRVNTQENSC
jgi:tRNA(adenine34) deaminase